jgi:prepilin-type N-terminal cleavage/methylation domain-containing protein
MKRARAITRGFTLIELMVVVAIMGIVLAMGIPAIHEALHREELTQGVRDVMEACSHARAQAILQDVVSEVRFHAQTGHFEVGAAPRDISYGGGSGAPVPVSGPAAAPPPVAGTGAGFSAQFSDRVAVELLEVNFINFMDADLARVRFYPNGTSDEFTMILRSDTGDRRKISLEVVTGLAEAGPIQ